MSDQAAGVSVALLFEARELSAHVRDTLTAIGAAIVYEAPTHALDLDALARSRANVVVVNLDAGNDPDLDDVYGLLEDARYRVVFNDGDVSSALSGWDHARWMRHLAAKILDGADIDPPRPVDAQAVPPRVPVAALPPALDEVVPDAAGNIAAADPAPATDVVIGTELPEEPTDAPVVFPAAFLPEVPFDDASDLIDFDDLLEMAVPDPAPPLPVAADSAMPAVADPAALEEFDIDGFDELDLALEAAAADAPAPPRVGEEGETDAFEDSPGDSADAYPDDPVDEAVSADGLTLSELHFDLGDGLDFDTVAAVAATPVAAPRETPAYEEHSALEWSLEAMLDELSELPTAPTTVARPSDFGIEKLRAEEFLAPAADAGPAHPIGPLSGLSLELMPLDEAVAPVAMESAVHENWLDPNAVRVPKASVHRIWVLGASIGGPEAVREFLAALPRDYPALFLLAQHLGPEFVDMMARQLAQATALTVRIPTHGERASHGEVLIVPSAQRLLVDAQGVVVLERDTQTATFSPSIDRVVHDMAERFGAAAGAIIFSGMSTDAAIGCRYLVEKGGSVYAQRPDTCVVSTMIDGVHENGLVSFFGSPQELAQRLVADLA